jgi:hypothetical protein
MLHDKIDMQAHEHFDEVEYWEQEELNRAQTLDLQQGREDPDHEPDYDLWDY